jgi:hypothetical protein
MDALTARTAHTPVEAHAEPYRLRRAPMDSLNWLAVAALALILVIFYFVRKIPAYLALSFVVAVGYAGATAAQVDWHLPSEWMVIVIGLLFWSFGLLIVRLMLVRSVSLRLLARMDGGEQENIVEDIAGRLHDMRSFRLTRVQGDGTSMLTGWGRFVGVVVAALYSVFRIEA